MDFSTSQMQNSLAQTIMKWLNQIEFLPKHYRNFAQLSDANIFSHILNKVDEYSFGQTFSTIQSHQLDINDSNWAFNLSRLKLLLDNIDSYYMKQYQQEIKSKINVLAIAKDGDLNNLLHYFSFICRIILESDSKDEFISPILNLNEEEKDLMSEFFNQLYKKEDLHEPSFVGEQQFLIKLEEIENENQQLQLQIQNLQAEHMQCTRKLEMYEVELKDKDVQINLLKTIQENNHKEEIQKHELLTEQKKKIWQLENINNDLQDEINKLSESSGRADVLKQELDQLKKRLSVQTKWEVKFEQLKDLHQQDKVNLNQEIEEKYKQIQKLESNYKELFKQHSEEKAKSLHFEEETIKLKQQLFNLQESCSEWEIRYNLLQQQLKEIQLKKRGSSDFDQSRSASVTIQQAQQLSQDISEIMLQAQVQKKTDFMEYHNLNLSQVEDNYKKEIQLSKEKLRIFEQQLKSDLQIKQRLEEKLQEKDQIIQKEKDKNEKLKYEYEKNIQNLTQKQQEQILALSRSILDFKKKYSELQEEQKKIYPSFNPSNI